MQKSNSNKVVEKTVTTKIQSKKPNKNNVKKRPNNGSDINKNLINKISSLQLVKNKAVKSKKHKHTLYQKSLLDPFGYQKIGVPSAWGERTVKFTRNLVYQISCNAGGCAAIILGPYLSDTTTGSSTFAYYNTSGYDGNNGSAAAGIALAPNMSITSGSVNAYRLCSWGVRVYTQDSALNRKGIISFALQTAPLAKFAYNSTTIPLNGGINLSNIQNNPTYKVSDMCSGEAAQICWVPYDDQDLELLPINTTINDMAPGHAQNLPTFIITGANSGTIIKIEMQMNFECTVQGTSTLFGFDTITPPSKMTPAYQVGELRSGHVSELTRSFTHHNEVSYESIIAKSNIAKMYNEGSNRIKLEIA